MTTEHPPLASDAVTVGSDDELKRALKARRQQIVLKAGVTFRDDYCLDIAGLLVLSERPQAAIISGEWVTAGDRMMVHGPLVKGGRIIAGGFDNILRRIEFTAWEGQAIAVVNGAHGYPKGGRLEIGWCTFHHPAPWGCPPGTKPQPSRVAIRGKSSGPGTVHLGGLIQHVHFHHLPPKLGPGYYGQTDTIELVPDGPSHPDVKTGWTYRFLLIEDHAGGDAVMDCKAGGETIEDVTILRCPKGRLDFRMGSGSKARRLWLGAGVGMSVSGSNHEIEDVYLEDGNLNLIAGSVAPDVWKRPGGNRPLYQQPMGCRPAARDRQGPDRPGAEVLGLDLAGDWHGDRGLRRPGLQGLRGRDEGGGVGREGGTGAQADDRRVRHHRRLAGRGARARRQVLAHRVAAAGRQLLRAALVLGPRLPGPAGLHARPEGRCRLQRGGRAGRVSGCARPPSPPACRHRCQRLR